LVFASIRHECLLPTRHQSMFFTAGSTVALESGCVNRKLRVGRAGAQKIVFDSPCTKPRPAAAEGNED
jgi:hypothetical protein